MKISRGRKTQNLKMGGYFFTNVLLNSCLLFRISLKHLKKFKVFYSLKNYWSYFLNAFAIKVFIISRCFQRPWELLKNQRHEKEGNKKFKDNFWMFSFFNSKIIGSAFHDNDLNIFFFLKIKNVSSPIFSTSELYFE